MSCPLVIDNGSGSIKVGLSVHSTPQFQIPTVVYKTRHIPDVTINSSIRFGDQQHSESAFIPTSPIQHGMIMSFDEMIEFWNYIFTEKLRVKPNEHPILMTEPVLNPAFNRERTTHIMFETFGVPCLYLTPDSPLALHAMKRLSGLVINCGFGDFQPVAVFDGYVIRHTLQRLHMTGDLADDMSYLLNKRGLPFSSIHSRFVARKLVETNCFVALDYEKAMSESLTKNKNENDLQTFELPDGQVISVDVERFQVPEVYFNPGVIRNEGPGIHHVAYDTLMKCEIGFSKRVVSKYNIFRW
eukprot:TRINITY_DN6747_c0_g1_i1.p1 TRINITY_DN6747_c0_g1~~TRINITY_DN6747_c0_g1_i1.p1  ORF type:complete len:299 (-),score=41.64 TRINITY_DN6747_c0_g1_i1:427-1323(-)